MRGLYRSTCSADRRWWRQRAGRRRGHTPLLLLQYQPLCTQTEIALTHGALQNNQKTWHLWCIATWGRSTSRHLFCTLITNPECTNLLRPPRTDNIITHHRGLSSFITSGQCTVILVKLMTLQQTPRSVFRVRVQNCSPIFSEMGTALYQILEDKSQPSTLFVSYFRYTAPFLNAEKSQPGARSKIQAYLRTFHTVKLVNGWEKCLSKLNKTQPLIDGRPLRWLGDRTSRGL